MNIWSKPMWVQEQDLVEVVRCLDCKWCEKVELCNGSTQSCCVNPLEGMASGVDLRPDDYCSYGERRYVGHAVD